MQPQPTQWARVARTLLAGVAVLTLAAISDAEFRLPSSGGEQSQPAVAAAPDGGIIVVWREYFPGGAQPLHTIRFQRFDASGRAVGGNQRVDVLPGDKARNPTVDIAADGAFVVAWEGGVSEGPYRRTIWARRFAPDGRPRGKEIRINAARLRASDVGVREWRLGGPAVSIAPDGGFLVVWQDNGARRCNSSNIILRRFNARGEPVGEPTTVNTDLELNHLHPAVDHDAGGNALIVWQKTAMLDTASERGVIVGRRLDAVTGKPGKPFAICGGLGRSASPTVAAIGGGSYVVTWLERPPDAERSLIMARPVTAEGRLSSPLEVASTSLGFASRPSIAASPGSGPAIVWAARSDDPWVGTVIHGRSLGTPGRDAPGDIVAIGPATCRNRELPAAAVLPGGDVVAVWQLDDIAAIEGSRIRPAGREVPLQSLAPTVAERWASLLPTEDLYPDAEARCEAARELGCYRYEASAVAGILRTAATSDTAVCVRGAAATALAKIAHDPRLVLPTLSAALRDPSWVPREGAIRGLGVLGLAKHAELLMSYLAFGSPETVRAAAASSLADIARRPETGPTIAQEIQDALLKATEDRRESVQFAAFAALAKLPRPPAGLAEQIFELLIEDSPTQALTLIGSMGPAGQPVAYGIRKSMEDMETAVRRRAIDCLVTIGSGGLGRMLGDDDPYVRSAAAAGLRGQGAGPLLAFTDSIEKAVLKESDDTASVALGAAWDARTEAECAEGWFAALDAEAKKERSRSAVVQLPSPLPLHTGPPLTSVYVVTTRSLELTIGTTESWRWFLENVESAQNLYSRAGRPFWRIVHLETFQDPEAAEAHLAELEALTPEQLSEFVRRDNPQYEDVLEMRSRPGMPGAMRPPPSEDE